MIKVLEFDTTPMQPGESRRLVLEGDAPFQVSASCFVDDPPPAGFRPCAACSKIRIIRALEPLRLSPGSAFPPDGRGRFVIDIEDSVGERVRLEVSVSGTSSNSNTLSAGA